MEGKFSFSIQSKYPHMKPADVHLWEKFIRGNTGFFDSVDYDFHIGNPPDWMDPKRDEFAAKEVRLYQKKIDVLGFAQGLIWIIEVKPRAGSSALGQILSYRKLFLDDHGGPDILRLAIVTNECQSSYCNIFETFNVRCFHMGICSHCSHYASI